MAERLRVAVDGRRLQDTPLGGVGRRMANLLPILADSVDLILLTDKNRPPIGSGWDEQPLRVPRRLPETVWLQVPVPLWLRRFDGIVDANFNMAPLACSNPVVLTINDLAPEHHPEEFSSSKRAAWRWQTRLSARRARQIIALSEYVKATIVDAFGIEADRISVAPPAVDPIFSPERAAAAPVLLRSLGIDRPYVVAIGGGRRRGLPVAVEAWRQARSAGIAEDLAVLGATSIEPEPGLHVVGRLADDDWAALLAGARALCYPTRYEGYGMPAIEAVASGVPVVAAPIGPLPEVLGPAAEWVEEPSVDAMSSGLRNLLTDEGRWRKIRDAGMARAAIAPTWRDSAGVVLAAYRSAAG